MTEDWEKSFSGLEFLELILPSKVNLYEKVAKQSKIRLETKCGDCGMIEVWTEDKDHEEFWNKIKEATL